MLGRIERRLITGEYLVILDPIPAISKEPFLARTAGCAEASLEFGTRVAAQVSKVFKTPWMLVVSSVRSSS